MGGRVSVPRGPAGTSEASRVPTPASQQPLRRRRLNTRQLLVPVAAVTLGAIFFVYSRTSIQAAKENARRSREADGGSISWRNEGLRRHGALEKPEERTLWKQLFSWKEDEAAQQRREAESKRLAALGNSRGEKNPIEEGIRRAREGKPTSGRRFDEEDD